MQYFICDGCGADLGGYCPNLIKLDTDYVSKPFRYLHLCSLCFPLFYGALNSFLVRYFPELGNEDKQ